MLAGLGEDGEAPSTRHSAMSTAWNIRQVQLPQKCSFLEPLEISALERVMLMALQKLMGKVRYNWKNFHTRIGEWMCADPIFFAPMQQIS